MKRHISLWLNVGLLDRLEQRRRSEGRRQMAIVEQALAEYLNVPLANRNLPEASVELCANCERGVLNEGRCADCGWHRYTREEQRELRARGDPRGGRSKHSKNAKEAA